MCTRATAEGSVLDIGSDHLGGTGEACRSGRKQADGAGARDDDAFSSERYGASDGMQSD